MTGSSSIMPQARLETTSGMPQAAMAAPARQMSDPVASVGSPSAYASATRPAMASCSAQGRGPMKRAWDATKESAANGRTDVFALPSRTPPATRSARQACATAWATRALPSSSTAGLVARKYDSSMRSTFSSFTCLLVFGVIGAAFRRCRRLFRAAIGRAPF